MSIKSDLKKDGIIVTEEINTLRVNSMAINISGKIVTAFPEYNLNQNDLFIKLSRLSMYKAKMSEGLAEASYFHKNTSIYFNDKISDCDLEEFAIHECIHYLQEVKDKKNNLIKMGLSAYKNSKPSGLGINEASVQLMTSKILQYKKEYVKYYGIGFYTTSPSYYPLECCLVNQLSYLVGENILFDSTLFSNDIFKNKLSKIITEKKYFEIESSLDALLKIEEKIVTLNNTILSVESRNEKIDDIIDNIKKLKSDFSDLFIQTQNLIVTSYFDKTFYDITNFEEIEAYRSKLYKFKDYIGTVENYSFFNEYYVSKMELLEDLYNMLEDGLSLEERNLALTVQNTSIFSKLLLAIKKLFKPKNSHITSNSFEK